MKKLIVLISLLVVTVVGYSQQLRSGSITLTPKIGINASGYYGDDDNSSFDYKPGLVVGAEGEYYIKDWLGISAGLFYSQQGASLNEDKIKTEYINVRILCNFHFGNCFTLKAGLQEGLNISSSTDAVPDYMSRGLEARDIDISMPIGMSFAFDKFVVDARYSLSLNKALRGENHYYNLDNADLHNSVFALTLGYRFRLK